MTQRKSGDSGYNFHMDTEELKRLLAGTHVPDMRFFTSIGSTNDAAMEWADQGGPDGALVAANQQTSGRGRNQRRWITRPDQALAFSIIFKPIRENLAGITFYSPMCALAVSGVLEKLGLRPQIKWPNDVLLDRKKISGILVESSWHGEKIEAVICGIGINIASDSLNPSDQVLFPASSIEQELGRAVDRWEVLKDVVQGLFHWRKKVGTKEFLQAWENRLAFRGEWVRIEQQGQNALIGKVDGIDPDSGSLRLVTVSGRIEFIEAGDVHLRPATNE
jgi:BirA family biotin operon repressor/biotin-[acetyl-CoA-carboxylase] ligase